MIYELVQGIRLPNPPYCPFKIGELMKKCFLENTSQRPGFKEIKESLQDACEELFRIPAASEEKSKNNIRCSYAEIMPLNQMKSYNMKKRSFNLQKLNHNKCYSTVSNHGISQETKGSATSIECACSLKTGDWYSKMSVKRKNNVPKSNKDADDIESTPLQYIRIDHTISTSFVYPNTGTTSDFTIERDVVPKSHEN